MAQRLFDELARGLATELPRRRLLLVALGAVVGVAVPARARATARPRGTTCVGDERTCALLDAFGGNVCCRSYELCCQSPNDSWCCDSRRFTCGEDRYVVDRCDCKNPCGDGGCCYDGEECDQGVCRERCPPGSTRCGPSRFCCPPRATCDRRGVCACADGRDFCRDACCKKGEECIRGECKPYCENETGRGATRVYDPATQCCTDFGIEPKHPIRYFERCRKTRVPRKGYEPTANGCGPKGGPKFPDTFRKASFLDACNAHDLCYGRCRSDRQACDERFEKQLVKACERAYPKPGAGRKACLKRAGEYHSGVVALGEIAYVDAQSEACQCCP